MYTVDPRTPRSSALVSEKPSVRTMRAPLASIWNNTALPVFELPQNHVVDSGAGDTVPILRVWYVGIEDLMLPSTLMLHCLPHRFRLLAVSHVKYVASFVSVPFAGSCTT